MILINTIPGEKNSTVYKVKREDFKASLTCKGEINGAKATEINLPDIICDRSLRIYQIKIVDLIQEGKSVKKGDFIAQLDQNRIMSLMREISQDFEKKEADLKNAKIDSTVKLTQLREEITNAYLDLEYNKIDLEQSVYESEAYQRKVRMNYQKAEIAIAKKRRDFQLEQNKLKVKIRRLETSVNQQQDKITKYRQAMASCRITTPQDGIVMFAKSWNGKKLGKDDEVIIWMPLIATLPDMSTINSEVYVKEIDISKINLGDSVKITFDALEGETLSGKITKIATIGEDHDSFDMKVFKVIIQLDHTNDGLKPGMSSNNEILVSDLKNVLTLPVNLIHSQNGAKYVYLKKSGEIIKTKVITGMENEEFIVIKEGLSEGDLVLSELPENWAGDFVVSTN